MVQGVKINGLSEKNIPEFQSPKTNGRMNFSFLVKQQMQIKNGIQMKLLKTLFGK